MDVSPRGPHHCARLPGALLDDGRGKVIQDPAIDLVYVASNHASHADYAIAALEAGKSVHIEKPMCG